MGETKVILRMNGGLLQRGTVSGKTDCCDLHTLLHDFFGTFGPCRAANAGKVCISFTPLASMLRMRDDSQLHQRREPLLKIALFCRV